MVLSRFGSWVTAYPEVGAVHYLRPGPGEATSRYTMSTMSNPQSELSRRTLLSGIAMGASVSQAAESRQPNVVLILADNLAYGDAGCYGGPILTPNIDRLARQGVRFTHAYSTTMCSPSRAMLQAGALRVKTGQQHGSRRRAHRGRIGVSEAHSLTSKSIDVRGADWAAIAASVAV